MHDDLPGTAALINVEDWSLEDLKELDSTPLRRTLESLFEEDTEPIAGFSSVT
ncbi:hypothetical protein [Nonomuraea sp. NPDC002799]